MAVQNIPKLTEQQKQLLLSKSAFSLPDNPSDKHFSSAQIKRKMYEGLLVLFDYINAFIDSVNSNVTLSNQDLQTMQSDIGTLQSFFENGICKKATADANGNNIASTYETKSDALSQIATALAEAKAYADALVQRSALVTTLGEASTTINGLMSAEDKAHLDLIYSVFGSSPEETARTLASAIALLSEAERTFFVSDAFTFDQATFEAHDIFYYDNGWKLFEEDEYLAFIASNEPNTDILKDGSDEIDLSEGDAIGENKFLAVEHNGKYYFVTDSDFMFLFKNGDRLKNVFNSSYACDRVYYTNYLLKYQNGEHLYFHSINVFFTGSSSGQIGFIDDFNFYVISEDPTPFQWKTFKTYLKNKAGQRSYGVKGSGFYKAYVEGAQKIFMMYGITYTFSNNYYWANGFNTATGEYASRVFTYDLIDRDYEDYSYGPGGNRMSDKVYQLS